MSTTTEEKSKNVLKSVNPSNGETLKTYPEMTHEEIEGAISKAHETYKSWRQTALNH